MVGSSCISALSRLFLLLVYYKFRVHPLLKIVIVRKLCSRVRLVIYIVPLSSSRRRFSSVSLSALFFKELVIFWVAWILLVWVNYYWICFWLAAYSSPIKALTVLSSTWVALPQPIEPYFIHYTKFLNKLSSIYKKEKKRYTFSKEIEIKISLSLRNGLNYL